MVADHEGKSSDLLEQTPVAGGSRSLPVAMPTPLAAAAEAARGRCGVNEPVACSKLGKL